MNKKSAVKLALLAPMLCAALALSASAQAQSGKRICGKWAALPDGAGYVGNLMEVENGGFNKGSEECDKVKKASLEDIFAGTEAYPYLASIKWTIQGTTACENIGKYFTSADHTKEDMCQYMEGYQGYAVIKMAAKNTTTYRKWGQCSKQVPC